MQIGEDHKRGISTKLRLLNKALSEFRAWAEGRESSSALREERNNLTEQQRTKLLAETDRMMAILLAVGNELGLEPHIDVADE